MSTDTAADAAEIHLKEAIRRASIALGSLDFDAHDELLTDIDAATVALSRARTALAPPTSESLTAARAAYGRAEAERQRAEYAVGPNQAGAS